MRHPARGDPPVLAGMTVVVTRPRAVAEELSEVLAAAGARVLSVPAIEVRDPADGGKAIHEAIERLARYRWIVFTSANAVQRVVPRLPVVGDARDLGGLRIAAVGGATAAALASHQLVADLVPPRAHAGSLVEAFPVAEQLPRGTGVAADARVLFPCGAAALETVPAGLRAKGWAVDEVVVYCTVAAAPPSEELVAELGSAHAIVFFSPSAVRAYLAMRVGSATQPLPVPPLVVCGGPTTGSAARTAGLQGVAESPSPSAEGVFGVLAAFMSSHPGTGSEERRGEP